MEPRRNVFAGGDGPSTLSDVLRKSLEAESETQLRMQRGQNLLLPAACAPCRSNAFAPGDASTFSDVLRKSLEAENETRAWFDEMHSYQHVRQSRVPIGLPKVRARVRACACVMDS
jgi:hypothetical protein